jgi:RNA polymerase sigma-70 factor (ECF subfamily)
VVAHLEGHRQTTDVAADQALATEGVAFKLPRAQQMSGRLARLLEVVQLAFNEAYVATSGRDWPAAR